MLNKKIKHVFKQIYFECKIPKFWSISSFKKGSGGLDPLWIRPGWLWMLGPVWFISNCILYNNQLLLIKYVVLKFENCQIYDILFFLNSKISESIYIFSHLKLCIAIARLNFTWLKYRMILTFCSETRSWPVFLPGSVRQPGPSAPPCWGRTAEGIVFPGRRAVPVRIPCASPLRV